MRKHGPHGTAQPNALVRVQPLAALLCNGAPNLWALRSRMSCLETDQRGAKCNTRLPDEAIDVRRMPRAPSMQANALQGALSPNNQSLTVFAPVNDAFNVQAFEVLYFSTTFIGLDAMDLTNGHNRC